jgi:hypothetical protein
MLNISSFQKMSQAKYLFLLFLCIFTNNYRYTESEEKIMSDLILTFIPLKIFDLLYGRAGAGAASKFLSGAGAT